jgi:L-lactate dehydrogenase (cytochrome)
LAGAGPAGVDRAISLLRDEIERDMLLMGCSSLSKLKPSMVVKRTSAG